MSKVSDRLLLRRARSIEQIINSRSFYVHLECGHVGFLARGRVKDVLRITRSILRGKPMETRCSECAGIPHSRTNPKAMEQIWKDRAERIKERRKAEE